MNYLAVNFMKSHPYILPFSHLVYLFNSLNFRFHSLRTLRCCLMHLDPFIGFVSCFYLKWYLLWLIKIFDLVSSFHFYWIKLSRILQATYQKFCIRQSIPLALKARDNSWSISWLRSAHLRYQISHPLLLWLFLVTLVFSSKDHIF